FLAPVIACGAAGSFAARRLFSKTTALIPNSFQDHALQILGDETLSGAFTALFRKNQTGESYKQAFANDWSAGLIAQTTLRAGLGLATFLLPQARIATTLALPFLMAGCNWISEAIIENDRSMKGEGLGWEFLYRTVTAATTIHGQARLLKAAHLHADDWDVFKPRHLQTEHLLMALTLDRLPDAQQLWAKAETDNPVVVLNRFLRADLGREPTHREVVDLMQTAHAIAETNGDPFQSTFRRGFFGESVFEVPQKLPSGVERIYQVFTKEYLDRLAMQVHQEVLQYSTLYGLEPKAVNVVEVMAGDGRLTRGLNRRLAEHGIQILATDRIEQPGVEKMEAERAADKAHIVITCWASRHDDSDDQILAKMAAEPRRFIVIHDLGGLHTNSSRFWMRLKQLTESGEIKHEQPEELNAVIDGVNININRLTLAKHNPGATSIIRPAPSLPAVAVSTASSDFNTWPVLTTIPEDMFIKGGQTNDVIVREVEILRELAETPSPHVVRFLGGFRDVNGLPVIALEKLRGLNFSEWLWSSKDGPSSLREVLSAFNDLLKGLAIVHQRRIVHNDLYNGNNLMIVPGRGGVLIDFGHSVRLTNPPEVVKWPPTDSGLVPEMKRYIRYINNDFPLPDHRVDLYLIGHYIFKAFAFDPTLPFPEKLRHNLDLIDRNLKQRGPMLFGIKPWQKELGEKGEEARTAMADIVRKATEHHPNDRYQTATEMRLALEEWLAQYLRNV
ncbi:MAG: serine/threonine-protein kinase, partial [Deltaproteobacteria bacterium]|nr:serine/threonine-protein kinase [Deltaproteobacteria bacterium]